jgi:hypothetical protein
MGGSYIKSRKARLATFTIAENEFLLSNANIVDYYKAVNNKDQRERMIIARKIEKDMVENFQLSSRDFFEVGACRCLKVLLANYNHINYR